MLLELAINFFFFLTVFVSAPQVTTDPRYTSEAHRAAADDENAPEGIKVKT